MLRLQVDTPFNRILELLAGFEKQINGFSVCHTAEIRVYNMIESLQQALVHKTVEELHLLRSIFQNIVDDVLDHRLCQLHVVFQGGKSNFRLNHPEFRCMPCSI